MRNFIALLFSFCLIFSTTTFAATAPVVNWNGHEKSAENLPLDVVQQQISKIIVKQLNSPVAKAKLAKQMRVKPSEIGQIKINSANITNFVKGEDTAKVNVEAKIGIYTLDGQLICNAIVTLGLLIILASILDAGGSFPIFIALDLIYVLLCAPN